MRRSARDDRVIGLSSRAAQRLDDSVIACPTAPRARAANLRPGRPDFDPPLALQGARASASSSARGSSATTVWVEATEKAALWLAILGLASASCADTRYHQKATTSGQLRPQRSGAASRALQALGSRRRQRAHRQTCELWLFKIRRLACRRRRLPRWRHARRLRKRLRHPRKCTRRRSLSSIRPFQLAGPRLLESTRSRAQAGVG